MDSSAVSIGGRLAAVLLLVGVNGFFVAAEFALVTVRRTQVETMLEARRLGAASVARAQQHLDTFIAACQLGITMASLALGWIGEPALADLVDPATEAIFGSFASAASHTIAVAISFTVITMLHVVAGELAPKGAALANPERAALVVAGPTNLFSIVFKPAIWLLNTAGWAALRPFGIRQVREHAPVGSIEELKLVVMASREAGLLEESEQRMVNRVFALSTLSARHVMVPRTEIGALPVDAGLDDVIRMLQEYGHTRIPVFEETIDNVIGILNTKELIRTLGRGDRRFGGLRRLIRPPLNVPETMKVDDLLVEMRRRRIQMAIVIDEFGGTAGLVTLEDILERIIGEVQSELERPEAPQVAPQPDGSVLLDGLMLVGDVNEQFDLQLEEEDYDTVGGYTFGQIGHRPEIGDEVELPDGRRLRVEALDGLRVARVRLLPAALPAAQSA